MTHIISNRTGQQRGSDTTMLLVAWLPLFGLIVWLILAFNEGTSDLAFSHFRSSREYTVIEMATAGIFALSFIVGIILSATLWRRGDRKIQALAFLVFSAFAALSTLEEIQWGQPLLGYKIPEWMAERNAQGEFTFHNLEGAQGNVEIFFLIFCAMALILSLPKMKYIQKDVWNDLKAPPVLFTLLLCIFATTLLKISSGLLDWSENSIEAIRWTTEITELYIALWALAYITLKAIGAMPAAVGQRWAGR